MTAAARVVIEALPITGCVAGDPDDLDSLEEIRGWYVEEVNVYFRSVSGQEKTLVERTMLPALEKLLPFKFESVEWWPEVRDPEAARAEEIEGDLSLRGLFRKWFGSK